MNRRTQTLLGVVVVLLGLGVYALGFIEQESTVRQVAEIHAAPAEYRAGTYTLLGIPQPERLALADEPANPEFSATVNHSVAWAGHISTHALHLERNGTTLTWTLTNTTRSTSSTAPVGEPVRSTWTQTWDGMVFQVDDFQTGEKVWALFDGVLRDPIQPKPSQLKGHLVDAPDGALIWQVEPDGYTVGCSSKFLPDDLKEEYDADGDGKVD